MVASILFSCGTLDFKNACLRTATFYTFLTKSAWTPFYYKFFCPKEQACFRNLLNLLPRVTVRAYVPSNGICRGFAFKYGKFLLPPRFLTALSVPKVPTRKQ